MADIFGGILDDFRGFTDTVGELFDRSDILNDRSSNVSPKDTDKNDGGFLSTVAEAAFLTLGSTGKKGDSKGTVNLSEGLVSETEVSRRSPAVTSKAVGSVDFNRFYSKWTELARSHAKLAPSTIKGSSKIKSKIDSE